MTLQSYFVFIRKPLVPAILGLASFCFSINVLSETYTWKDEHGRVHFSDAPPVKKSELVVEKIEIEEINPPKSDPEVLKRREKQYKLLEVYLEESKERQVIEEKQKQQKQEKEFACKRTQNKYQTLQRVNLFYKNNQDGTRSYMTEEQRADYKQKLEEQIKLYCR